MDRHYSVEFFSSFLESLQNLCHMYLTYNQAVEITGYLSVEIDNVRKERFALCEILQANGNVVSDSHCLKAFNTSDICESQSDFRRRWSNRFGADPYSEVIVLDDHTECTDEYEEDAQAPFIQTISDMKKKNVGPYFEKRVHSNEMHSDVGSKRRHLAQERLNQNTDEVIFDHTINKLYKPKGLERNYSNSVDRNVKMESVITHNFQTSVSEAMQDSSENNYQDCLPQSNHQKSCQRQPESATSKCLSYSPSSQYQPDTHSWSKVEDSRDRESKKRRLISSEVKQNTSGGFSELKNQEHQQNMNINVKAEMQEDVTHCVFKNSIDSLCEMEEVEHPGMSAESEFATTPKFWTTVHHTELGFPEGEEEIILDDEEEDDESLHSLDTGCIDTSLLDTAAQYKLATFKKPLQSALNTFIRFLHLKQVKEPVLSMSPETLNQILAEFYVCARTKIGHEFTSGSLRTIRNYLEFFLQHNGYPLSIAKSREFAESVHVLKKRLDYLRSHEKCSVAVRRGDIDVMYNSGILGTGTAEALLRTLWLMITIHFQIKGAKKHQMMNWGDFELEVSNEGEEYLYYKPLGVIARGNRKNPSRCFIRCYKTYRDLRPVSTLTDNHPFYLEIANNHFQTNRVCENAMKCMWKRMLVDANLPKEKKILDLNIL